MGKTYKTVEEYLIGETGKDMTGMSKQETQNAESAFAGYKQKNNLQNIYDSAVANMDKNLQTDQRTAYFNNEKLMKYLPNNLKVQGLQGNVGAMNQAYIDANNSYQTNLNALTQNYNQTKTNMLNDYNTNVLKIDESVRQEQNQNNKYWQDVQNALDAEQRANTREDKLIADERAREDKLLADERAREDSKDLLNSKIERLGEFISQFTPNDNGEYTESDYKKITEFISGLDEGLNDSDKALLTEEIKSIRSEEPIIKDSTTEDGKITLKTSKGETLSLGGELPWHYGRDSFMDALVEKYGSVEDIPNGITAGNINGTPIVYYNGKVYFAKKSY